MAELKDVCEQVHERQLNCSNLHLLFRLTKAQKSNCFMLISQSSSKYYISHCNVTLRSPFTLNYYKNQFISTLITDELSKSLSQLGCNIHYIICIQNLFQAQTNESNRKTSSFTFFLYSGSNLFKNCIKLSQDNNINLQMIKKTLNAALTIKSSAVKYGLKKEKTLSHEKLEQLQHSAEIAMNYVFEISKINQQTPLMERLITMKIDNVDSSLLQKKRQIFTIGFQIDNKIFSQARILRAIQKENGKGLFCFYPTTMVTSPIFNQINSGLLPCKVLIYGPFGISKTISIALYYHLSNQINQYLYICSDQERLSFRQKWLTKKVEIPKKLLYWSIDLQQTQKEVLQTLRKQCPQVFYRKKNINQIKTFKQVLYEAYQSKQMGCDVVIDQINQIASVFRRYNMGLIPHESSQVQNALKSKFIFQKIYQITKKNRGNIFFNSPMNIEEQLLGEPSEIGTPTLTLNLNYHTKAKLFKVDYNLNLKKPVGQLQIDLILAKQILKCLPQGALHKLYSIENFNNKSQQQTSEEIILKNEITKLRGDAVWDFYVRPLNIYQAAKQNRFTYGQITVQALRNKIMQIMRKLKLQSRNKMISNIKSFLSKGDRIEKRQQLMAIVYAHVLDQIKQIGTDIHKNIVIQKSKFQGFYQRDFDKELFLQHLETYEMQFSYKQFKDVFEDIQLSKIISQKLFYLLSRYHEDGKSGRNAFSRIVQDSFTKHLSNFYATQITIIDGLYQNFKLKKMSKFLHFNSQSGTVYDHLQGLISLSLKGMKDDEYILGFPKTAAGETSHVSESIDFLLLNLYNKVLKVYSFDFATGQNVKYKLEKTTMINIIERAKGQKQFFKIKSQNRIQDIQWEHYLIASPLWAKQYKEANLLNPNYKCIAFNKIIINRQNKSVDLSIFQKGVELMANE